MLPQGVVDYSRDGFLLARGGVFRTGEEFEAALHRLGRHHRYGCYFVQGAGLPLLFGRRGASGFRHEIDVALQGDRWVALLEAKTGSGGPSKSDVVLFDGKTFDLYADRLIAGRPGPHVRILVSSTPARREVATFAAQRGIVCVQPDLVPLPLLLRLLGLPIADRLFSDWEMAEADRLFTPACRTMEEIWRLNGTELSIHLRRFDPVAAISRAMLHRAMSDRLIGYLDRVEPGWAEERAMRLARGLPLLSSTLEVA